MKAGQAVEALGSLAQDTRLTIFRLLVQRGPSGLPAGTIAEKVGVPSSSLSFHLQHLARAGLISRERRGRQRIYAADFGRMNALVAYLSENCCGQADVCAPACNEVPGARKARKVVG